MIPIPKSKPKASRDLVIRKATEAWADKHGTSPLPERFVLAVRGYYSETIGEEGSVFMTSKTERNYAKPVLGGVAFVVMILRCLFTTYGAGKGFNVWNPTASSRLINNASGLTSIWMPLLVIAMSFAPVFNSSGLNFLGVFQCPFPAGFLVFIPVLLVSFASAGVHLFPVLLCPLLAPLFAYFLIPKPVSLNRSQSGFSVFSRRFTRNLPMALLTPRRDSIFPSRALNEIRIVFRKTTLHTGFCHA